MHEYKIKHTTTIFIYALILIHARFLTHILSVLVQIKTKSTHVYLIFAHTHPLAIHGKITDATEELTIAIPGRGLT